MSVDGLVGVRIKGPEVYLETDRLMIVEPHMTTTVPAGSLHGASVEFRHGDFVTRVFYASAEVGEDSMKVGFFASDAEALQLARRINDAYRIH
jgi:hypothetical protein